MPALELLISNKKLGQVGEETLFGEAYFGGKLCAIEWSVSSSNDMMS